MTNFYKLFINFFFVYDKDKFWIIFTLIYCFVVVVVVVVVANDDVGVAVVVVSIADVVGTGVIENLENTALWSEGQWT